MISYCERGRVSIKTFPDIFQFVTSEATIDDLGGLPLLTVRDFALRGYMLIFKRVIDFMVAAFGLIFVAAHASGGNSYQIRIARTGFLRARAHGVRWEALFDD